MVDLKAFQKAIRDYCDQAVIIDRVSRQLRKATQADLAAQSGMSAADLSRKLNGHVKFQERDVRNIIRTLASWEAITSRGQAIHLLALMGFPPFAHADWRAEPLNKLKPDDEELKEPEVRIQTSTIDDQQYQPPFDEALLNPPEHFVGRKEDLKWLRKRLLDGGTTSISALGGMGGIGKTALAAIVIQQMHAQGHFREGIGVVICLHLTDTNEVIRRALARFDPQRRQPETNNLAELTDVAHRLLDGKNVLIVLDNIEPELDVDRVVAPLRAASATLLLTARQALPHTVVGAEASLRLDLLSSKEALDLFTQSFGRDLRPFERAAAIRIVSALDRHTFAVKVIGAYLAGSKRDLSEVAEELEDPQQALELSPDEEIPGDEIPRTVAQVFTRSTDALPREAQRLFAALAAIATEGFGRQASWALAAALNLTSPEKTTYLLVRRALLEASVNNDMPKDSDHQRLRFHPLMRAFAAYKFSHWQQNERDAVSRAVADYYAHYTEKMSHGALDIDDPNITGALDWAYHHQEAALAAQLCSHMYIFWRDTGRTNESLRYLPLGTAAAEVVGKATNRREDHLREAELALAHGQVLRRVAELDDAERAFKVNLAIRREIHDQHGEGVVLGYLGRVAQSRGRLEEAERFCREALAIHREVGDRREESVDLDSLGEIFQTRGRFEEAKPYLEQALAIQREVGHQRGEGITLCFLGMGELALGRFDEARNYLEQALSFNRVIHSRMYEGVSQRELGYLALACGQPEEADQHFQKALEIASETVDRQSEIAMLPGIAALTADQGDLERAEQLYRRGLAMGRKYQYTPRVADTLLAFGCFLLEWQGKREEGCSKLMEARQLYMEFGSLREKEVQKKMQQLKCGQ